MLLWLLLERKGSSFARVCKDLSTASCGSRVKVLGGGVVLVAGAETGLRSSARSVAVRIRDLRDGEAIALLSLLSWTDRIASCPSPS